MATNNKIVMANTLLASLTGKVIDKIKPTSFEVDGTVNVKILPDYSLININYDNRLYVGRFRLIWENDQYNVYFVHKKLGVAFRNKSEKGTKGAYMKIETVKDVRSFVKMYEMMINISALGRTRA